MTTLRDALQPVLPDDARRPRWRGVSGDLMSAAHRSLQCATAIRRHFGHLSDHARSVRIRRSPRSAARSDRRNVWQAG